MSMSSGLGGQIRPGGGLTKLKVGELEALLGGLPSGDSVDPILLLSLLRLGLPESGALPTPLEFACIDAAVAGADKTQYIVPPEGETWRVWALSMQVITAGVPPQVFWGAGNLALGIFGTETSAAFEIGGDAGAVQTGIDENGKALPWLAKTEDGPLVVECPGFLVRKPMGIWGMHDVAVSGARRATLCVGFTRWPGSGVPPK